MRASLARVLEKIAEGWTLSGAMALDPEVFDETFRTVVRYGEIYGELDETLRRYADDSHQMFRPCGVKRES